VNLAQARLLRQNEDYLTPAATFLDDQEEVGKTLDAMILG
jgi:hypothetical protein